VAAETEAQRRFALGQMGGSIRVQYEFWRERIIRARGLIEAEIDFSDEEGVTGAWSDRARLDVRGLAVEMQSAMADLRRADRIREGAEVVILGAVNAGKSSLINALARRDVAIVSPEAGTTRDLIEAVLDIGGYRVTLVDTAGLRDAEGSVEREGIRRARARADGADLVLWLSDSRESVYPDELLERRVPVWHVATKADIADEGDLQCVEQISRHIISTVTGEGMDALLSDLGAFLDSTLRGREPPLIARARHRSALAEAVAALDKALAAEAPELAAEHLRIAADRVGTVTGRVSVEDVLDVVFREFCIGK
jgi:tRNA modification GTPase